MLWQPNGLTQTGQSWRRPQGGADAAETTAFLARTSGLDATHTNAYKALINGLVADGVFSLFDILYIYAAQDQTTALLNLPNSTYAGVNADALAFAADAGFSGDDNASHYISLGFNPATASSPNFTQNSAHVSIWNLSNIAITGSAMNYSTAAPGTNIFPKYTDNNIYMRVNDDPDSGGFAVGDPRGHILGNRSSSTARQGYLNNASVGSYGSQASAAPTNDVMAVCLNAASPATVYQIAMASAGGSLDATQAGNFYTRLRTYMTAVGVP